MMTTMTSRPDRSDRPRPLDPWLIDLYRSEYRSLVRLAALLVDDVGTAEELVQDAFVATAMASRRDGLADPAAAPAYLRSAVLNRARSHLRHRGVRRRHLRRVPDAASAPGADGAAVAHDETRIVMAAINQLPTQQRAVVVLRYYEDLTEAEIATALNISVGSVKTHAHRGLAALESLLAPPEASP